MEKKEFLYEGKAKRIYGTENPDLVIIEYKDDITAFNGEKKDSIPLKGEYNNLITEKIFNYLIKKGIPTHFIERLNDRDQLCKKVDIVPLEVITRNKVAGSMAKRVGIEEGTVLKQPIFELSYKNDDLGDPFINDSYAIALDIVTEEELSKIYELTGHINEALIELFKGIGIDLIDHKIEFGRTMSGEIVLADEISPDTCRLWDLETGEKIDKDRFRRGLGDVEGAYAEISKRLGDA